MNVSKQLRETVENDNLEELKELIEKYKIDINSKYDNGNTLLHFAAIKKHLDIILYLITNHKVKIDANNQNSQCALYLAIKENKYSYQIVKDLEDNVDEIYEMSEILQAIEENKNSHKIVELLIEAGANVNEENDMSRTALYPAIENNDFTQVKYLVEHGADVNVRSWRGETPLHLGMKCSSEMVIYLVKNGANLIAVDTFGETPVLLIKRYYEHLETLKNLGEIKLYINRRTLNSWDFICKMKSIIFLTKNNIPFKILNTSEKYNIKELVQHILLRYCI